MVERRVEKSVAGSLNAIQLLRLAILGLGREPHPERREVSTEGLGSDEMRRLRRRLHVVEEPARVAAIA